MLRMLRFKTAFPMLALCLLLGVGAAARVGAQDAATTATSPIVGVWVTPQTADDTGSIVSFSSDGIVHDQETDGTIATGTWEATGAATGTATFVFFMSSEEFSGAIVIRATLTYDDATDTLTAAYTVTGATPDGTVVWSDDTQVSKALTRMAAQGPEMAGQPLDGLVAPAAAATPTA